MIFSPFSGVPSGGVEIAPWRGLNGFCQQNRCLVERCSIANKVQCATVPKTLEIDFIARGVRFSFSNFLGVTVVPAEGLGKATD